MNTNSQLQSDDLNSKSLTTLVELLTKLIKDSRFTKTHQQIVDLYAVINFCSFCITELTNKNQEDKFDFVNEFQKYLENEKEGTILDENILRDAIKNFENHIKEQINEDYKKTQAWFCPACSTYHSPSILTCPNTPYTIVPNNPVYPFFITTNTDCGCPPNTFCGNAYCPRAPKITCAQNSEFKL